MSANNLNLFISETKPSIDSRLNQFFNKRIHKAAKINSDYKKLLSTTAKVSLRSGKRLRPTLAVLGYKIAGGIEHEKIILAAMSLEIFHNYLLIHDDIMDRDDYRHGGLNIAGVYTKQLSKILPVEEARHHAMSFAINAGDISCGLCYEALLESKFPSDLLVQAIALLSETTFTVASGQQLDIIASFKKDLPLKKLIAVAKLKTADYSVIMPLQFGAILANAKSSQINAMQKYGEAVGIAFQLTDDVLGMFGVKKTIGKPEISDLREGKQTVLMYYGKQFSNSNDNKILKSIFGNSMASNKDLRIVRNILESSGAKAKTMLMAQVYIEQAISFIPDITNDKKYIGILKEFAYYCISRNK